MDLSDEGIIDELRVLQRNSLDCLLNHMVAVLVLDALQHMWFDLFDEAGLLIHQDVFESL